jgi:hypothetical protein
VTDLEERIEPMTEMWNTGTLKIGGRSFGVLPICADLKVETIGPRSGPALMPEFTFDAAVKVDAEAWGSLLDVLPRATPPVTLCLTDRTGATRSMSARLGAMTMRKLYRGRPRPGQWSERARKRRSKRLARSAERRGVPYMAPVKRFPRFGPGGVVATVEALAGASSPAMAGCV